MDRAAELPLIKVMSNRFRRETELDIANARCKCNPSATEFYSAREQRAPTMTSDSENARDYPGPAAVAGIVTAISLAVFLVSLVC